MPKALAIIALVVSALLFLIFVLDLVLKIPFGGASPVYDVAIVLSSLILAYLSWSTMREVS